MQDTSTAVTGDYATVAQLAQRFPVFTAASIRWLLFNSKSNGLEHAIIRVGRRVLISVPRFVDWLESHRAATPAPEPTPAPARGARRGRKTTAPAQPGTKGSSPRGAT